MGKLSIARYAGLCVLGSEVMYGACMIYGTTLTGKAAELHRAIFELLPGFTWLSVSSVLMGAVTVALWSAVGGTYISWMHNVSIRN